MELNKMTNKEIIDLIKQGKIEAKDLTDASICPTCFDKENGNVLYGSKSDKIIYEDNLFECFLVGNPRSVGHMAISTKKHFKDMMELDNDTCIKAFILAKELMKIIKEVYHTESVYLCTMCDGPMNHFHIQLIPRYANELRGSKNFVKPRLEYIVFPDKIDALRKKISNFKY